MDRDRGSMPALSLRTEFEKKTLWRRSKTGKNRGDMQELSLRTELEKRLSGGEAKQVKDRSVMHAGT
jgi:hypothetical protein